MKTTIIAALIPLASVLLLSACGADETIKTTTTTTTSAPGQAPTTTVQTTETEKDD